uniref:HIT domain-containing protein n=1 Tax=Knipowitschia caucasica TaxID=637954 RepID=A0AAV2K918_KNICA
MANNHTGADILLSDGGLLCIRDQKPGAAHHYLIIPKEHINNCLKLQPEHIQLVLTLGTSRRPVPLLLRYLVHMTQVFLRMEQMRAMGMRILHMNNVSDSDIKMGFHVPPFSSVAHLHLHVLAPVSQMCHRSMLCYGPQSHWFITVDDVLSQLKTRGKKQIPVLPLLTFSNCSRFLHEKLRCG